MGWVRRVVLQFIQEPLSSPALAEAGSALEICLPCIPGWIIGDDGGVSAVMDWVTLQQPGVQQGFCDSSIVKLSVQKQQSAARVAYFLGMPKLTAVLLNALEINLDSQNWLSTLHLARDLDARRLRNACVRMG